MQKEIAFYYELEVEEVFPVSSLLYRKSLQKICIFSNLSLML